MNHPVVSWLIATQLLICMKYGACANSPCRGENWISFEDKCFKLIEKQATYEEAKHLCNEEHLNTDDASLVPTLASIKSAAEQTFLTKFVFDKSRVESNLWIGAKKIQNENSIVWDDDSFVQYTNWAEGSPSEQIGNDCVEMQWRHSHKTPGNDSYSNLQTINGKWRDVKCGVRNYFVCEKLQWWSCSCSQIRQEIQDLRKELTDLRRDSEHTLHGLQNELEGQQNELEGLRNEMEGLQRNPVPIGFVYVQLSNQPQPSSLWPQTQWENISSAYAGLFFRVLGGSSAAFGETQNENSPRISEIRNIVDSGTHHVNVPANDDWTSPLWTGGDLSCVPNVSTCDWSTLFRQSAGEVRPRNQAVQIWKRIQ